MKNKKREAPEKSREKNHRTPIENLPKQIFHFIFMFLLVFLNGYASVRYCSFTIGLGSVRVYDCKEIDWHSHTRRPSTREFEVVQLYGEMR